MFGIVMGTLSVIGALAVVGGVARAAVRHSRYHPGSCGHEHHRGRGRGRQVRRGFSDAGFARAAGETFKRRLRLYEDQEDIVEDAALAAVFSRHYEALNRARLDVVSAFIQVHAVLSYWTS